MLCGELPSAQEQLEARRLLTEFVCAWTLRHRCLAQLLVHDLLPLETDCVAAMLSERAWRDIDDATCPSPAVDTFVAYLLQIHRLEQAQEIHQAHEEAVLAVRSFTAICDLVLPYFDQVPALAVLAREALGRRRALVEAHSHTLRLPAINFEIIRYLKDVEI